MDLNLKHAWYVGSGGTGCTGATNPDAWSCETVDSAGDVGKYTSVSIDSNNKIHISYYDQTNGNLYCFWNHENAVTMKKLVDGVWEDSTAKPFGASPNKLRALSCFYQVWDGKIGVAILEQPNDNFELKYNIVDIS